MCTIVYIYNFINIIKLVIGSFNEYVKITIIIATHCILTFIET